MYILIPCAAGNKWHINVPNTWRERECEYEIFGYREIEWERERRGWEWDRERERERERERIRSDLWAKNEGWRNKKEVDGWKEDLKIVIYVSRNTSSFSVRFALSLLSLSSLFSLSLFSLTLFYLSSVTVYNHVSIKYAPSNIGRYDNLYTLCYSLLQSLSFFLSSFLSLSLSLSASFSWNKNFQARRYLINEGKKTVFFPGREEDRMKMKEERKMKIERERKIERNEEEEGKSWVEVVFLPCCFTRYKKRKGETSVKELFYLSLSFLEHRSLFPVCTKIYFF